MSRSGRKFAGRNYVTRKTAFSPGTGLCAAATIPRAPDGDVAGLDQLGIRHLYPLPDLYISQALRKRKPEEWIPAREHCYIRVTQGFGAQLEVASV